MKQLKLILLTGLMILITACSSSSNNSQIVREQAALDKIMAYAGDQTQAAPAVEDYTAAGVQGVTEEKLDEINKLIATLEPSDVDTKEEIQKILDDNDLTLRPDTIPPLITLSGDASINLLLNATYIEEGATAEDNVDGNITANIVVGGDTVDTSIAGTYRVTYNVSDAAGNPADEVTRTVNVTLGNAPEITLIGDTTINLLVNAQYVDPGATATDIEDGDISGSIVIDASAVNTVAVGSYSVTYNVMDAAGNPADEVTRTVNVTLGNAPDITLTGDNPYIIEVNTAYVEPGATATDAENGTLAVTNDAATALDTSVLGDHNITYIATDSEGNTAQAIRIVRVVDTTAPVITLSSDASINLLLNATYVEEGASCTDNYDTTCTVTTGGDPVDTSTVGSYNVTYNASDAAGNPAQAIRTVNVTLGNAPLITLAGDNPYTIEANSVYTDPGATATDIEDGTVAVSNDADTVLDTAVLGDQNITYIATDTQGNSAQAIRTVRVVDTTPPEIMLIGDNPMQIEVGLAAYYIEPGATATDSVDGNLTTNIEINASAINAKVVGTYTVTYNVSDAAGNAAMEVNRTVEVTPDVTNPVISLKEGNATIEVGSTYTDAGATAFDSNDGDITANIATDNPVNGNAVGTYTVRYNVSDAAGNPADEVTRTVTVVDKTIPIITLTGGNVSIELGTPYTDAGATASDNVDGDITANITTVNPVNVNVVGTYTVTYNVSDTAGNAAVEVTRTVEVTPDVTEPVITLIGGDVSIALGSIYTDAGATALDNVDGDITANIITDNQVNANAVGTYTVTYNVSDAAGNAAAKVTRTVTVVDETIPIITLTGDNPQEIEVGSTYTELGATANDNEDGDISADIVIDKSAVNTSAVGSYSVTYNVSDAAGNAAVEMTRTVNVVDMTPPAIVLPGDNPQEIPLDTAYTELGATATDNVDGDISADIVIDKSAVNTSAVGSYSVTYNVSDAAGNAAVEMTRTVNVVDMTPPVITLLGGDVSIAVGSIYTDAGATALDNVDGDITGDITTVNPVNVNVAGTYTVTYNVSDLAGNAAVEVTRTVTVYTMFDEFVTDTTGDYTVDTPDGDSGTFTYDSANQRALALAPRQNSLLFSRNIAVVQSKSFSIDFLPVQRYGLGGQFVLRLEEDANNYYEIYNSEGYGPGYIKKFVNGSEVDSANFTSEYTQGMNYPVVVSFSPTSTKVQAFGEILTLNTDTTAINVNSFSVKVTQQDAYFDNIYMPAPLRILSPVTKDIQTGDILTAKAAALHLPSGWGVKFVLDGGTSMTDTTEPYEADFGAVMSGEHNIDAYIVDDTGAEQVGDLNRDSVDHIGTGGEIMVAMGDSITEGFRDDDPSDNTSSDGRNTGGGFEPILNDLLTAANGNPHSIFNEGIGGTVSADGLAIVDSLLAKHPEATTYLIMYGTNDARADLSIDKATFKSNMQQIITKIKTAGKTPLISKIPRVMGESAAGASYEASNTDPEDGPRNIKIRTFNEAIDELATENSIIAVPPDLYTFFVNYGDTYDPVIQDGYVDNLHPDGLGYQGIADQWKDAIIAIP